MSSIKKVLCLSVKDTCPQERLFTTYVAYDVVSESLMTLKTGRGFIINDNHGRPTTIIIGGGANCVYGEWQPLEEYVCMSGIYSGLKIGDTFFGYLYDGMILSPLGDGTNRTFFITENFKKVSEIPCKAKSFPRFEVRHVIYDTKDNKIANDAMGECYITLAEAQELCDEMNAPKVMKTKHTKEVEYFGMRLFIREDVKFIATSKGGVILATSGHFTLSESCHSWVNGNGTLDCIDKVDLNGIDWKDTLVEIK